VDRREGQGKISGDKGRLPAAVAVSLTLSLYKYPYPVYSLSVDYIFATTRTDPERV